MTTNEQDVALFYIDASNADLTAPTFAESGIEVTLLGIASRENLDDIVINDFHDNYEVLDSEVEVEDEAPAEEESASARFFTDLGLEGLEKAFPEIAADLITKSLEFSPASSFVQDHFEAEYSDLLDDISLALTLFEEKKEAVDEEAYEGPAPYNVARLVRSKDFLAYAIAQHLDTFVQNVTNGDYGRFEVLEGYYALPVGVIPVVDGELTMTGKQVVFSAWEIVGTITHLEDNDTVAIKDSKGGFEELEFEVDEGACSHMCDSCTGCGYKD